MKKENIIILLVVTHIACFVAGAVAGIEFYAGERRAAGPVAVAPLKEQPGQTVNPEVIGQAEELVRREPQNLQALITLGNLYFDSRQPHKAIDVYARALAIDPTNPDVRTDLGIMYRAIKDYDRAIKEFREVIRKDPTHKHSRFNLAVVLEHDKKDTKGALAAWEEFLKIEPSGKRADMARAEIEQLKRLSP